MLTDLNIVWILIVESKGLQTFDAARFAEIQGAQDFDKDDVLLYIDAVEIAVQRRSSVKIAKSNVFVSKRLNLFVV